MKQGTFTVNILEPENGGYITQKEAVSIPETILSKKVFLAVNDSVDNYKEITEEEAEVIKQAQKELDPSLYPTAEENKIQKISFFNSVEKAIVSERNSINTLSLTDNESLKYKIFYPVWEDLIGTEVDAGFKFTYKDTLYRVKQKHTLSLEWNPESGTESLYEEVNETNAGTLEDPIPYNNNMELEINMHYSQNGIIYLCFRGTEQPVYQNLEDLVGIYVNKVEE